MSAVCLLFRCLDDRHFDGQRAVGGPTGGDLLGINFIRYADLPEQPADLVTLSIMCGSVHVQHVVADGHANVTWLKVLHVECDLDDGVPLGVTTGVHVIVIIARADLGEVPQGLPAAEAVRDGHGWLEVLRTEGFAVVELLSSEAVHGGLLSGVVMQEGVGVVHIQQVGCVLMVTVATHVWDVVVTDVWSTHDGKRNRMSETGSLITENHSLQRKKKQIVRSRW